MSDPAGGFDFGSKLGNALQGNVYGDLSDSFSKSSNVTTTSIDREGMNYLLKTILGDTQGLAATAGADNTAGLYDSATTDLLVNNLLTQASGFVASKNVTTTSDTSTASQDSPLKAVGGLTVICTELHRQGISSDADYHAGREWSLKNVPEQMLRGYQFWAIPYVRLMRKSKLATRLFIPITHGRYDWILRNHWTIGGYIAMRILAPMSFYLGYFVGKQDYKSLYVQKQGV